MTRMEYTGESYKCDKCGFIWHHEDDACPNCGSDLYIFPIGDQANPTLIPNIQKLQNQIKKWSDGTFGKNRTGIPIIHHLKAETDEVIEALTNYHQESYLNGDITDFDKLRKNRERVLFEFADCFMLLIDAAAHEQITIDMLTEATKQKLEINKKREWGKPNDLGYTEHIKK